MSTDLKTPFIIKALSTYMEDSRRDMRLAAQRLKVGITGEGMASIAYKALKLGEGSATAEMTFREYLRFVDMGVGRGHPLAGLTTMKATLQASKSEGLIQVKDKTFKPRKVYSKPAYSRLTWLQNQLLYGYTETAIEALKNELLNANNSSII